MENEGRTRENSFDPGTQKSVFIEHVSYSSQWLVAQTCLFRRFTTAKSCQPKGYCLTLDTALRINIQSTATYTSVSSIIRYSIVETALPASVTIFSSVARNTSKQICSGSGPSPPLQAIKLSTAETLASYGPCWSVPTFILVSQLPSARMYAVVSG